MSYVLFLGFKAKIYKKNPLVRVWLDDLFLHEFDLTRSITGSFDKHSFPNGWHSEFWRETKRVGERVLSPETNLSLPWHKFVSIHWQMNSFAVEINKKYIDLKKQHKLKIEITNTDNNYTNGFMTKTTLVQFCYAYLVPRQIALDPLPYCEKNHNSQIRKKKVDRLNNNLKDIKNMMFKDFTYQNPETKFKFDLKDYGKKDRHTAPLIKIHNLDTFKDEYIRHMAFFTQGIIDIEFPTSHVAVSANNDEYFGDTKLDTLNLIIICNKYHEYENHRSHS